MRTEFLTAKRVSNTPRVQIISQLAVFSGMKRKPFEALSPPPPSKPLPHPANLPKEFKEEDERPIATTIEDERLTVTTIKKDHHHHDNNYERSSPP